MASFASRDPPFPAVDVRRREKIKKMFGLTDDKIRLAVEYAKQVWSRLFVFVSCKPEHYEVNYLICIVNQTLQGKKIPMSRGQKIERCLDCSMWVRVFRIIESSWLSVLFCWVWPTSAIVFVINMQIFVSVPFPWDQLILRSRVIWIFKIVVHIASPFSAFMLTRYCDNYTDYGSKVFYMMGAYLKRHFPNEAEIFTKAVQRFMTFINTYIIW